MTAEFYHNASRPYDLPGGAARPHEVGKRIPARSIVLG